MHSRHMIPLRRVKAVLGAFVTLTLAACAGSPSTLAPASSNAGLTANLFNFLFAVALAIFVIVEFLLFYSVVRFRRKSPDEMPRQIYGNTQLEIAWTAAPALILVIVFAFTWQTLEALATMPTGAVNVEVVGHQWWWQVEYPDLGVVTANEIHLPVGQPASLTLQAKDVIHSFWAPELGGKMDLIPGKTNRMWIRPDRVGTYHGQCAEFCGISHANMRFLIIVESRDQFVAWVAQQKAPAAAPASDLAKSGAQEFAKAGCAACHTINGTEAQGKVGPNLTHVAGRTTIEAGTAPFNAETLRAWISNPQAAKPGALMPKLPLSAEQIEALVAYLETLK